MLLPDWDVFWDFVTSQLPWVQLQFLENGTKIIFGAKNVTIFMILPTYVNQPIAKIPMIVRIRDRKNPRFLRFLRHMRTRLKR